MNPRTRLLSALLLVSLLFSACSLPNPFGDRGGEQPANTPQASALPPAATPKAAPTVSIPVPPAVIQSDPPPNGGLSLDRPLVLTFNQPMDQQSVEQALEMDPPLEGRFTWTDERTLQIQPEGALPVAEPVAVMIAEGAKAANGQTLETPITLQYQTPGWLQISQRLPAPDALDVDPSAAIVASFTRPVAVLGGSAADQPAPFTLEPATSGTGEWLNTTTYVFKPGPPLSGGTQYTVRVSPNLRALDGARPEPDQIADWSFTTALPKLVSLVPSSESPLPIDEPLVLTFNQPMDPESVQSAFSLVDSANSPVAGSLTWNEDHTVLTFTPGQPLARGMSYTLNLAAGAQSAGGAPLPGAVAMALVSVPALAVTGSDPAPGATFDVGGQYGTVRLQLSAPLGENDLDALVTVTPTLPDRSLFLDVEQQTLYLSGFFAPNTAYTVTIGAALKDKWGLALGAPYVLNFQTGPAQPQLTLGALQMGSSVIYLTPQDSGIPAQATNLSELQLSLGTLPAADFWRLAGQGGYENLQNYTPADQRAWTQALTLPPDQSQALNLALNPENTPLAPGLYLWRITTPRLPVTTGPITNHLILVVSGTQVLVKVGQTSALVWATRMADHTPIAGAPVTLADETGRMIAQGTTDAQGLFRAEIAERGDPYQPLFALVGQPGEPEFGMASDFWSQGLSAWEFGVPSNLEGPGLKLYLYTDRPIYRPGQTVYFRGVVREQRDGRYQMPDLLALPLELYGVGAGVEGPPLLLSQDFTLSSFGTLQGEFTLPENALPGYYRLTHPQTPNFDVYFQVADYRKPELDLQVTLTPEEGLVGRPLQAAVSARYFFGAPAAQLPVRWALYRQPDHQFQAGAVGTADAFWGLSMGVPFRDLGLGALIDSGEGVTAADGSLALTIPTRLEEEPSGRPQRYTVEITAEDEANLPVSARAAATLHPEEFYAIVRADSWSVQAQTAVGFSVKTVGWTGDPRQVQNLQARFERINWQAVTTAYGYIDQRLQPVEIASAAFATDAETGEARLSFTPPQPGTYRLRVTGGQALSEAWVWVGGPGTAVWPALPNQRLVLTPDAASYQPGQTAQVFVPNPFGAPVSALVTQERGEIHTAEIVTVEANGSALPIPLDDTSAPNVYLSVTLLGTASGQPGFRQGYVNLSVAPVQQMLNVQVQMAPETARPGDEVSIGLTVTDASGEPVRGEFSLALVDAAALALADPNSQPIDKAFYGLQPLSVQTGLSLAVYAGRAIFSAGGQGGGGGAADQMPFVRDEFRDTAFWSGEITTDANGQASITAVLPDNLTTWVADLRGVTADTRVGQASAELITSKELVIRPALPRTLVAGDHVELAAVVQNNTPDAMDVQVSLQAGAGITLDDPAAATQTVSLAGGERLRVTWWATVEPVEQVDLTFTARAGDLEDIVLPEGGPIPVRRYQAPQTFATAGVLEQAGQRVEGVSLPPAADPLGGALRVELSPSLATVLLDSLEPAPAEDNPLDLVELAISRLLPGVIGIQALAETGADSARVEALRPGLDELIGRLQTAQNDDGGWGWTADSQSSAWITSYALFALLQAQQAGFTVPPATIDLAAQYLSATLPAPEMTPKPDALDQIAFTTYVLQLAGVEGINTATLLTGANLGPAGKAWLALARLAADPADPEAGRLLSELENEAVRSATGAHWEAPDGGWLSGQSTLQVTAVVVAALAGQQPDSPLVLDGLRYLLTQRRGLEGWNASYQTAWSLFAVAQALRGSAELQANYSFSAALNGQTLVEGEVQPGIILEPARAETGLADLPAGPPSALVIARGEGPGRLYYTADLQVFTPVEQAAALDQGILIERTVLQQGQPVSSVTLASGAVDPTLTVRLSITAPHDLYHVVVQDFAPAGAEILDIALRTTQQGEEVPFDPLAEVDPADPFADGWGWWHFGQPRVSQGSITWTADTLPAGTYVLTYRITPTHAGEFRVLPARAWEWFFPEVQGTTEGAIFTIQGQEVGRSEP